MRVKTPEGNIIDAAEVSVVEGPYTRTIEFVLSDGAKLHVRVTILSLFRAINEFGDTGEPKYLPSIRVDSRISSIREEYYGKPPARSKKPSHSPEVA